MVSSDFKARFFQIETWFLGASKLCDIISEGVWPFVMSCEEEGKIISENCVTLFMNDPLSIPYSSILAKTSS